MEFRILGPLTVCTTEGTHTIRGSRHRKILAAMLVEANHAVSMDRLVDTVWDESPPATAVQQVQNCVGSLRKLLTGMGGQPTVVRTSSGYALVIEDGALDAQSFREACAMAEAEADRGDHAGATARLRRALDLWRGKPLADVQSDALAGVAVRLEEMRVRALEQYVRLELAAGRHAPIVADLVKWTSEHRYHEALHGQLAMALYRSGRTAEALRVIHELRTRLRCDLGIDAGRPISSLQAELLNSGRVVGAVPERTLIDPGVLLTLRSALVQLTTALDILTAGAAPQPGDTAALTR
jgi:DNA-binding SARP family transcriptional activator